jgi:hypothetical protein
MFTVHGFLARTAHVTIKGKHVTLTVAGESLDVSRHPVGGVSRPFRAGRVTPPPSGAREDCRERKDGNAFPGCRN